MVLVQPGAPLLVDASAAAPAHGLGFLTTMQRPVARSSLHFEVQEEVLECLADRQEDITTVLIMVCNLVKAARISGLITDATRSLRSTEVEPSMVSNMVSQSSYQPVPATRTSFSHWCCWPFPVWRDEGGVGPTMLVRSIQE